MVAERDVWLSQERIPERTCEQVVDVRIRLVVEQVLEVPKNSSQDRNLQGTVEQIPEISVLEETEQLVEVPETVSRNGVQQQQRTVEQIVDASAPQAVEELAEVSKVFSQDGIQQRIVEQTIPATSLAETIVVVPVIHMQGTTQQGANTHVQHVVDTVEVEKPKIIELTVQRKKFIIQEKINQETKPVEFPQAQFLDKVDDMVVDVQRHVPMAQTVRKTVEVPPLPFINKVVDNPIVAQRQISMVRTIQKTTEIPQLQCLDEVIDVPAVFVEQVPHVHVVAETAEIPRLPLVSQIPQVQIVEKTVEEPQSEIVEKTAETPEIQMVRGTETSESLSIAPACQLAQARTVEAVEIGAIPLTESARPIFVTTPVLETPPAEYVQLAPAVEFVALAPAVTYGHAAADPVTTVAPTSAPRVQKIVETLEVPQIQYIDKIVDAPVVARSEDVSVGTSDEEHGLVQEGECESKVDETREKYAAGEDLDLLPVAPNMEAGGSHLQATAEEERIVDWTQDLREIRRMVEFLVRRERKLDVKADVAVRRLARLEKEHSQQEDEECEASLPVALADRTKVVKLVVDKWFVDKGFGFGRVPTGEVIFIHASVVRGAEVLTIGTDAWVQVVHDDARAQGGYRACKAWGRAAWKEERDKERAAKVAEQVRRAAALTAELAAQSEKEVSEVCSHPPGLHDETAAVTPQPACSPSLATSKSLQAGSFRATRPRSNTRAHDNAAMLEETLRLVVEATGKDEASARRQLVNKRPAELLRARDIWRTRVEEKQRFQTKKKEAWEFFRRMPSFKPKSQEEFEEEFRRRVMTGYFSGSDEGREKYLVEWMIELQKKALEGDRNLEARERVKMGQEDSNSRRRSEWERIFERSPFLKAAP